ncbi:putative alpha-1 2-mannosidase [Monocercomonoides exilis]|uniref:putative alpha-1 2-mannosidase n=1 Tax=Monocercomonoides exilis TaxID=2049356 RepID=UPI00355A85CC|nr:putative alpha-1 2-mannosidase [Monocercomonoides exilis]|eukprot:MONOS_526.1-p1 / transcript=MONOS_526.1 / gene=MONOS_526 / organism=Monocercomonoides_exilis_PA203 / gene_product=alpha-1 2-mannosidase / transcript_product=alpha-1 2-mannosidase / location=Mono_scaffold00008:174724-176868(-) / protein_length=714 / sequence_SO=supercontig / SO=protein_coding / is_pseudo=false
MENEEKTPADYINPLMGTVSQLLVPAYPTIHLPNGMVRLIPDRENYLQEKMNGFPRFLTSHRGSYAFSVGCSQHRLSNSQNSYSYTYDEEIIRPYLYSAYLEEEEVDLRIAPCYQSMIYEMKFLGRHKKIVVFSGSSVSSHGSTTFSVTEHVATSLYLYGEVNPKPMEMKASGSLAVMTFDESVNVVVVRCGVSLISVDQAKKNLEREIKTFDLDTVAAFGKGEWNKALGKVSVVGGTEQDKAVLYSSMYRTYERMVCISEDGKYYSGFDRKVHNDDGVKFYTDDWIWDTFRATHPLRVLIESKKEVEMLNSYLRMAQQSSDGFLPTFPEVNGDSHRMNGKHCIATIWDAYCKGLRGFDLNEGFSASKRTQMEATLIPWTRQRATTLDAFFKETGFYPGLRNGERETCWAVGGELRQCVAVTQAASYDDWCVAQMAKELGPSHEDDYHFFLRRAFNYRTLFKPDTCFFHPRDKEGRWIMPFDYRMSGGRGGRMYYDENNGWTYRWDVQHAPADLVSLMGGNTYFAAAMDSMFKEPIGTSRSEFWRQWPDQTANVGQFTMANEPSMHIPWYYNHAMHPWKSQKVVHYILKEWFRSDILGIPGDEDGGGLCAYAVFSSIGFYPFTPGIPAYLIGSPLFDEVQVKMENGKVFTIKAQNASFYNKYIQSATLNGKEYNKCWISHEDVTNGSTLVLTMGEKPNKNWGIEEAPPSSEQLS